MLLNIIIGALAAMLLILILWFIRGIMLLPVKLGGLSPRLTLSVEENTENLDRALDGLIWLRENGTLKTDIFLSLNGCDELTRFIAETYSGKHSFIDYGDG